MAASSSSGGAGDVPIAAPRTTSTKAVKAPPATATRISMMTMAFMTIACVASIRNTPSMAVYGYSAIFLYIVPALLFLIPTALVAAELASGWKGGIYRWTSEAYGPKVGFFGIWTQFAQTIFYYPSLLASVASTLAFVIDPELASNGLYTAIVILVAYWAATFVTLRGVGFIARLSSAGMVIGTLIPGVTLVVLGAIYLTGDGQNYAADTNLLPEFTGLASLVLIVNNFLSYAGMEVNAVHVNDMDDPGRDFPRAMLIASCAAVCIFVLPALAISFVVPADQLSLTAGVMQAFDQFFAWFGIQWLTPIFAVMIVCAMLGGMMGWLAGPSKGLLQISRDEGYLPPALQKVNERGVQENILLAQGVLISAIALLFAFIPQVSNAFWILSAMTTQVYLMMYVLMFLSAMRLRRTQPDVERGYRMPALFAIGGIGLLSSIGVFLVGLVPPSQFGSSSSWAYPALLLSGVVLIGLVIPALLLRFRRPEWRQDDDQLIGEVK
jgi:putative glutamate/gamma-aminobutyrate antiporter